jgi:hypothetical protein
MTWQTKDDWVHIRISKEKKSRLQAAVRDLRIRSLSSLTEDLLQLWLEQNGYDTDEHINTSKTQGNGLSRSRSA